MSSETHESCESIQSFRVSPGESISEAVIRGISAVSGLEPVPTTVRSDRCLDPLYTAVDPDALDSVFPAEGTRTVGTVKFSYHDYEVTVHSMGRIVIEQCVASVRPEP